MYARNVFPNIEISSNSPDTQGRKLHHILEFTCFETNVQLTDLNVLVYTRKMFYTEAEENMFSGFTELALRLMGEKLKDRIRRIIYKGVSFLENTIRKHHHRFLNIFFNRRHM